MTRERTDGFGYPTYPGSRDFATAEPASWPQWVEHKEQDMRRYRNLTDCQQAEPATEETKSKRMRDKESRRLHNHPRRTLEQSIKLSDSGWFPFPELTESENDEIFVARLSGFGPCFAMYPDAHAQANRTLAAARKHNLKANKDYAGTEGRTGSRDATGAHEA